MTPAPFGLSFTTIPHMAPFGTTGRHYTCRIPPVKAFFCTDAWAVGLIHSVAHEPAIVRPRRGARPPDDSGGHEPWEERRQAAPRSPVDSPGNRAPEMGRHNRLAIGPGAIPPTYRCSSSLTDARRRAAGGIGADRSAEPRRAPGSGANRPIHRWLEPRRSGSRRRLGEDGQLALVEVGGTPFAVVVEEDGADPELAGVGIPIRPPG